MTVQTTVVCSPFLPIPIPGLTIPGLNSPVTIWIGTKRAMEDPDNAGRWLLLTNRCRSSKFQW